MSFLKKLFGGATQEGTEVSNQNGNTSSRSSKSAQKISRTQFPFGRYTDRNKTQAQRDEWHNAIKHFDNKQYVDSFEAILKYIQDPQINNLSYERADNQIKFSFVQGSNVVEGNVDNTKFTALSAIAKMSAPSVPVMRKLMQMNYSLKYSKFALSDGIIYMKLSSKAEDASPNKLYYGLRELARKADQQDDLLISEFSSIEEVGEEKIIAYPPEKLATLTNYLDQWIRETLEEIKKYDRDQFCGGIAFLLLRLSYRIDYLIKPQGQLMDRLDKIQHMFFSKNNETTQQRNDKIIAEFQDILSWENAKKQEGLYDTISTFALINPSDHKTVMDMVFDEMKKADWYINNRYDTITQSIFEYSVAYAFFNYGMHYPTMHIFDILMEIFNPDFYRAMGVNNEYIINGTLNRSNIEKRLKLITSEAKKEFPKIDFRTENINYNGIVDFYKSLMKETDYLNYAI